MVDDIDDYSYVHTDVGNGVGKWYDATMMFLAIAMMRTSLCVQTFVVC